MHCRSRLRSIGLIVGMVAMIGVVSTAAASLGLILGSKSLAGAMSMVATMPAKRMVAIEPDTCITDVFASNCGQEVQVTATASTSILNP